MQNWWIQWVAYEYNINDFINLSRIFVLIEQLFHAGTLLTLFQKACVNRAVKIGQITQLVISHPSMSNLTVLRLITQNILDIIYNGCPFQEYPENT